MLDQPLSPMLAHRADPFDSVKHLFEIKWDGTRCVVFKQRNHIRLQNRRLLDISHRYPEIVSTLEDRIDAGEAILDGELVILAGTHADFQALQRREQVFDAFKINLLSEEIPATFVAFDLLYRDGRDMLRSPLLERKEILSSAVEESQYIILSRFIREQGMIYFRKAVENGLEGIMAKNLSSPYIPGKRSRFWLKCKRSHSEECYIIGYTPGEGRRRPHFGSLVIATRETGGKWVPRGRVGSGFKEGDLEKISKKLRELKTGSPAFPMNRPERGTQWVKPKLRCEVHFQEQTESGHFRAPVFIKLKEE
jgi:DNA ligase D-like protein (predicted ligase)